MSSPRPDSPKLLQHLSLNRYNSTPTKSYTSTLTLLLHKATPANLATILHQLKPTSYDSAVAPTLLSALPVASSPREKCHVASILLHGYVRSLTPALPSARVEPKPLPDHVVKVVEFFSRQLEQMSSLDLSQTTSLEQTSSPTLSASASILAMITASLHPSLLPKTIQLHLAVFSRRSLLPTPGATYYANYLVEALLAHLSPPAPPTTTPSTLTLAPRKKRPRLALTQELAALHETSNANADDEPEYSPVSVAVPPLPPPPTFILAYDFIVSFLTTIQMTTPATLSAILFRLPCSPPTSLLAISFLPSHIANVDATTLPRLALIHHHPSLHSFDVKAGYGSGTVFQRLLRLTVSSLMTRLINWPQDHAVLVAELAALGAVLVDRFRRYSPYLGAVPNKTRSNGRESKFMKALKEQLKCLFGRRDLWRGELLSKVLVTEGIIEQADEGSTSVGVQMDHVGSVSPPLNEGLNIHAVKRFVKSSTTIVDDIVQCSPRYSATKKPDSSCSLTSLLYNDVLAHVFSYGTFRSCLRGRLVCSLFKEVSDLEHLWKLFAGRRWPALRGAGEGGWRKGFREKFGKVKRFTADQRAKILPYPTLTVKVDVLNCPYLCSFCVNLAGAKKQRLRMEKQMKKHIADVHEEKEKLEKLT